MPSGAEREPATTRYDAVLLVSFGGPEGPDDVMPFLENVTRGREVPPERLQTVARHYQARGGVSPINAQCRALLAALDAELRARGHRLRLYWGNRNWHPLLVDTVTAMAADGVRRALALVTSATSSYSGCRQYLEDIARARAAVGAHAPIIDKIRQFYDHPGFVEAAVELTTGALASLPEARRPDARLVFCAHSIPVAMARTSDYEAQLREASRLVAERVRPGAPWELVFQSRSGPPSVPWLEPDVGDHLRALADAGVRAAVLVPIGFVSDHMEVIQDLDVDALAIARRHGITAVRAPTVGRHPRFVAGLCALVEERLDPTRPRLALGRLGIRPDVCPPDCCPPPAVRRSSA